MFNPYTTEFFEIDTKNDGLEIAVPFKYGVILGIYVEFKGHTLQKMGPHPTFGKKQSSKSIWNGSCELPGGYDISVILVASLGIFI